MLITIHPSSDHKIYDPRPFDLQANKIAKVKIDTLMGLFKVYQKFTLSPKIREQASFVITETNERGTNELGIYGGAIVYPQKVGDLYDKISSYFEGIISPNRQVYCVRLFLSLDPHKDALTLEQLVLHDAFYEELYEALCKIGQAHETNLFILTLTPKDYFHTKRKGGGDSKSRERDNVAETTESCDTSWPYLMEFLPQETSDKQFQGLLILDSKLGKRGVPNVQDAIPPNSLNDQQQPVEIVQ